MRRLATALVLFLSLPAIAQEVAEPAVEIEIRLPFLPAGGAIRPAWPVHLYLPDDWGHDELEDWELSGPGVVVDSGPGPVDDRVMLLWPDVDALLDDLPGAATVEDGLLSYLGPADSAERLRRRISAVAAALAESVRIRIAVGPEGGEPWLDIDGAVPVGALLVEDARIERSFPAGVDLDPKFAAAEFRRLLLGTALKAAATPLGRDRYLLRLSFVHLALHSEKRFEGGGMTVVSPETITACATLAIPLKPGVPAALRSHGISITVTVEPANTPAPVPGVRTFSLGSLSPLFDEVPIPTSGPERLWFRDAAALPPEAILLASGLTRMEVDPGLLVIEGEEAKLVDLDRELDAWWSREVPAIRVRGPDVDLTVARGRTAFVTVGRRLPVVVGADMAVQEGYIREAPALTWIFAGRSTVLGFPAPGLLRMHEIAGEVLARGDRRLRIPLRELTGPREIDLPRTDLRVETKAKTIDLPLDGTAREGCSAREEAGK